MTEFNFTVRATDNLGAFADREFSINVRNTIVDRWVATVNGGSVITSPDGVNWTLQENVITGSDYVWNSNSSLTTSRGQVIHFNGKWFIFAGDRYLTSTDAKNWTQHTFPSVNRLDGALMNPIGTLIRTQYAPNWCKSDDRLGIIFPYRPLGETLTYNVLITTTDGENWTPIWQQTATISASVNTATTQLTWGNGTWLVSGNRLTSGTTIGYKSTNNGETWTTVTSPLGAFINFGNMFINGKWIAPRTDESAIYISDDLTNWSYQTIPMTLNSNFRLWNWNYGNGVISSFPEFNTAVTPANWNRMYSTVDLVNWSGNILPNYPVMNSGAALSTPFISTNTSSMLRISSAFYNGQFIFGPTYTSGSNTGGLLSSTDGKTYTRLTLPTEIGDNVTIFGIGCSSY